MRVVRAAYRERLINSGDTAGPDGWYCTLAMRYWGTRRFGTNASATDATYVYEPTLLGVGPIDTQLPLDPTERNAPYQSVDLRFVWSKYDADTGQQIGFSKYVSENDLLTNTEVSIYHVFWDHGTHAIGRQGERSMHKFEGMIHSDSVSHDVATNTCTVRVTSFAATYLGEWPPSNAEERGMMKADQFPAAAMCSTRAPRLDQPDLSPMLGPFPYLYGRPGVCHPPRVAGAAFVAELSAALSDTATSGSVRHWGGADSGSVDYFPTAILVSRDGKKTEFLHDVVVDHSGVTGLDDLEVLAVNDGMVANTGDEKRITITGTGDTGNVESGAEMIPNRGYFTGADEGAIDGWTAAGTWTFEDDTNAASKTAGAGTDALSPTTALPIYAGTTYMVHVSMASSSAYNAANKITVALGGDSFDFAPGAGLYPLTYTDYLLAVNSNNLTITPTVNLGCELSFVSVRAIDPVLADVVSVSDEDAPTTPLGDGDVLITGTPQAIDTNAAHVYFTVKFGSTSGHTFGDYWTVTAKTAVRITGATSFDIPNRASGPGTTAKSFKAGDFLIVLANRQDTNDNQSLLMTEDDAAAIISAPDTTSSRGVYLLSRGTLPADTGAEVYLIDSTGCSKLWSSANFAGYVAHTDHLGATLGLVFPYGETNSVIELLAHDGTADATTGEMDEVEEFGNYTVRVERDGLADDGSGTISGQASVSLELPSDVLVHALTNMGSLPIANVDLFSSQECRRFLSLDSGVNLAGAFATGATTTATITIAECSQFFVDEVILFGDPDGQFEILKITAVNHSAGTLTVVRSQYGSVDPGANWGIGTDIYHVLRLTGVIPANFVGTDLLSKVCTQAGLFAWWQADEDGTHLRFRAPGMGSVPRLHFSVDGTTTQRIVDGTLGSYQPTVPILKSSLVWEYVNQEPVTKWEIARSPRPPLSVSEVKQEGDAAGKHAERRRRWGIGGNVVMEASPTPDAADETVLTQIVQKYGIVNRQSLECDLLADNASCRILHRFLMAWTKPLLQITFECPLTTEAALLEPGDYIGLVDARSWDLPSTDGDGWGTDPVTFAVWGMTELPDARRLRITALKVDSTYPVI